MMVFIRESSPFMAKLFRLVKYDDLPWCFGTGRQKSAWNCARNLEDFIITCETSSTYPVRHDQVWRFNQFQWKSAIFGEIGRWFGNADKGRFVRVLSWVWYTAIIYCAAGARLQISSLLTCSTFMLGDAFTGCGRLEHDLYFPYIGNNHPNWLIFSRGIETTN